MKQIIVTEELAAEGLRVVRGKDWIFGNQDHCKGKPGIGTIIDNKYKKGWTKVRWDNGREDSYRVGSANFGSPAYDLYVYTPGDPGRMKDIKPTVQEMRDALSQSIKYVNKEDCEVDQDYEKRGYDIYGKSLKTDIYDTDTRHTNLGPFKVCRPISTIEGPKRRSRT